MRGDERSAEVRRKMNLFFLTLTGACSARGETGARMFVGCFGEVGLGVKARDRARGESGEFGEPFGDFPP